MSRNSSPIALTLAVIGVIGAILLVVSLFLDWYSLSFEGEEVTLGGWNALEFGDVLFVLALIGSIAALFSDRRAVVFLALGVVALVFVAVAAATNVPVIEASTSGDSEVDTSLEAGVYVAAGGVLLLLIAGGLGMAMDAEARPEADTATPPPSGPAT